MAKKLTLEQQLKEIVDYAVDPVADLLALISKQVSGVVEAFTNKGSHPAYHDEQMRHLETHWPTLYFELKKLAEQTPPTPNAHDFNLGICKNCGSKTVFNVCNTAPTSVNRGETNA